MHIKYMFMRHITGIMACHSGVTELWSNIAVR